MSIRTSYCFAVVRDDIHKSAPVPPAWRTVVKHCTRDADRDERAKAAAARAMLKDIRQEVSENFMAELNRKCSDRQSVMFNGTLDELTGVTELGGSGHVLEQSVLDNLRRLGQSAQLSPDLLTQAVESALKGRGESRVRAMVGHVLKDGGWGVQECVASLKSAVGAVALRDIAESLVQGNGKVRVPRSKRGVGLEENLLEKKK
jgi:hypothetical protein